MKIVLDTDVIIHFISESLLYKLPSFIPNHEFVVLDAVFDEVIHRHEKAMLEGQILLVKNITLLKKDDVFDVSAMRTFFDLKRRFGDGESACMAYCHHHRNDTVGSNNTKDITEYCETNGISYLTTTDLLHIGVRNGVITEGEARQFLLGLKTKGTFLRPLDMSPNQKYNPYLKTPY